MDAAISDRASTTVPPLRRAAPQPAGSPRATAAWPQRFVTPRTGMLPLFPSYFGHRTRPTGVTEPRICVAFDVVAAKPPEPHEPNELK